MKLDDQPSRWRRIAVYFGLVKGPDDQNALPFGRASDRNLNGTASEMASAQTRNRLAAAKPPCTSDWRMRRATNRSRVRPDVRAMA